MPAQDPCNPLTTTLRNSTGLCADGAALDSAPALQALGAVLQALAGAERSSGPGRPASLCQAHTDLARALSGLRAYSLAQSHLVQALHWAGVMGATDTSTDLHCALAEVATNVADLAGAQGASKASLRQARSQSRHHALEAARLAGHTTDPHWEVKVLLRASDVLDRCGSHGDAVQLQYRAMALIGLHNPAAQAGTVPPGLHTAGSFQITAPGQLM